MSEIEKTKETAQLIIKFLHDFEDDPAYTDVLKILTLLYKRMHPDGAVDFYEQLRKIREISEEVANNSESLRNKGERFFLLIRPLIEAWQEHVVNGKGKVPLSPIALEDIRQYEEVPNAVNLVDMAYSITNERGKASGKLDLLDTLALLTARLCKRWEIMREAGEAERENTP